MTEGTKSYLIGCHQFLLHPLAVLIAWRIEYKSWPKWWEIICVFLHDVGVCGRQYLSDDKAKIGHWVNGAIISASIVETISGKQGPSIRALCLVAGHAPEESGYTMSKLARPDKRSWTLGSDKWWLNPMVIWEWWNYWVEFHGKVGVTAPPKWRRLCRENLKRKTPIGNHQLYILNRE